MNKINRELKRVIQDEKKVEAQIEALKLNLEELVTRRQQLSREAIIKAFESKKLGRDEFFDVVEGIASGKVGFDFLQEDDSEEDEEIAEETDADISAALNKAATSVFEVMNKGDEHYAY